MKKKSGMIGTIICTVIFNFFAICGLVTMITDEYSLRVLGATIFMGSFGVGAIMTLIDTIKERKGTYKESNEKTLKDLAYLIAGFGIVIGAIIVAVSMGNN